MIIIGYQGIGKSSVTKEYEGYIDLESSNFRIDGVRPDDWYKYYCKIAESLSAQGYIVFLSSHKVVRDELRDSHEQVYTIFPSLELKDDWINRLQKRYDKTQLDKDYRALMNAKDVYDENIKDLLNNSINPIEITNINYKLEDIIDDLAI